MKQLLSSKAFIICLVSITFLFILGLAKNTDVAMSIAAIAMGLSGARALEGKSLSGRRGPKNKV